MWFKTPPASARAGQLEQDMRNVVSEVEDLLRTVSADSGASVPAHGPAGAIDA